MIKVKAKENFTLGRFGEIKNLKRFNENLAKAKDGWIGKNDEFECEGDLAKYLLNDVGYENPVNRAVVEVIRILPEKVKEEKKKVEKKTTKKQSK